MIGGIGPTNNVVINNMIKQSQQYTDELIEQFEDAIKAGYTPDSVYKQIFEVVGCDESDLTYADKARLKRKVESAWQSARY